MPDNRVDPLVALFRKKSPPFTENIGGNRSLDVGETQVPIGNFLLLSIPLDIALVDKEIPIQGDFILIDRNSTGVAFIKMNSPAVDKFPVAANTMIKNYKVSRIFLSCAAQPGLILNLWYGRGIDFFISEKASAGGSGLTDAELRASPIPVDVTDEVGRLLGVVTDITNPIDVTNFDVALSTRASQATLATLLLDATFIGRINTQGQKAMAASTPVVISNDQSLIPVDERPALLNINVAGAANAIATATLPAPGAGLFHYITHIFIKRVATAALAGGAILSITTTNLAGRQWRTGNQMSITVDTQEGAVLRDQEFTHPLKSAVANTASTIVCPAAGAAVSWHLSIDYFTAP
jgi:hypothetical protein